MSIADQLEILYGGQALGQTAAYELMLLITEGCVSSTQLAALLSAYRMRLPNSAELSGFRQALLERSQQVDLEGMPVVDLCGTGGDGKDSFNISTLSAFVVAGAGVKVAKHGNYGASSRFGSSSLLELLGVPLVRTAELARQMIDSCGICFLHAPYFHPALKHVASTRKDLGFRTIFNLLGPLVNPTRPMAQLIGVYSPVVGRLFVDAVPAIQCKITSVHSYDGYDEVSLTCDSLLQSNFKEEQTLTPGDFGFDAVAAQEIAAEKSPEKVLSAALLLLQGGAPEAQERVVLANSALAINLVKPSLALNEALAQAQESLRSGGAYKILTSLMEKK